MITKIKNSPKNTNLKNAINPNKRIKTIIPSKTHKPLNL
tara:strand:- start:196 stop:312 length:117 start_codon:yes stop_codon:yes gene_type:complete